MTEHQSWIERITALIGATGHMAFIWFLLVAIWGGTTNYITRLRKSKAPFSIMELIGEWSVSAFAGIITAFICHALEFSFYATAALAGITGHMGGRAIGLLEQAVLAMWSKRTGIKLDEDHPQ